MLLTTAGLLVLAVLGALLLAWSGLYNVAASAGHFPLTRWFLAFGMENSVETQSLFISAPDNLDDPDLVKLGAGHYQGGCAPCHGAPGQSQSPVAQQMMPPPPRLEQHVPTWSDSELFWIVKHGIKYTGMPAWPAWDRDDEVWAVTAFLRRLPQLDPSQYLDLARGNIGDIELPPRQLIVSGTLQSELTACARCHGDGNSPPTSGLVPLLAGQKELYLAMSLRAFATGRRNSGIMRSVAAELDEREIAALSSYYAGLESPRHALPDTESVVQDQMTLGRILATTGDISDGVPPCLSCHRVGSWNAYPLLNGQSAAYLENQLRLWKQDRRSSTPLSAIMTTIAQRLDDRQIEAVAAWFEQQPAMVPSAAAIGRPAAASGASP